MRPLELTDAEQTREGAPEPGVAELTPPPAGRAIAPEPAELALRRRRVGRLARLAAPEDWPALDKRLWPLYLTAFLQGFGLWYAVEKLFMRSIGMSNSVITINTSIYIVVMTVANVPIGVIADRWSRKGVLYIATTALVASSVVCGLANGFLVYAVGISMWGLYYACYAGTYDAIVYDVVLEQTGTADGFERHYGRVQIGEFLGSLAGSLASVAVVQLWSVRETYFLTVPFTLCAFLALRRFNEPALHKAVKTPLLAHLREIVRTFVTNADLVWIVLCTICASQVLRLLFEFQQLWYLGLGLPTSMYGVCNAFFVFGAVGGGYLAGRLPLRRPVVLAIALVTLAGSAGLFFSVCSIGVITAQTLALAGVMILTVALSGYLHDEMPSHIRTAGSSVASTLGYGVFVPVAITFGLTSQHHGIFHASWFLSGALIGICIGLLPLLLRAPRRAAVEAA